MSKRVPRMLLLDILESAEKIVAYTEGMTFEEFTRDGKTIDAVVRNFQIIGEAANRLPVEFKDTVETVDWFQIRGFRNRIVHDYSGIRFSVIWQLKEEDVPGLMAEIKKLIDALPE
jgi:uncharacterized protein with HEPN domain